MGARRDLSVFLLGVGATLGAGAMRREPSRRAAGADVRPDLSYGDGPGRHASGPTDIPAGGWKSVLARVWRGISDDRLLTEAAGVTFYVLLALFPALAALVSLYGLFADPATIERNMQALAGIIPGGGMDIINAQVHSLADKGGTVLGFGLFVGLLTSLWSANSGVKSLFDALNVVYEEHEKRGYVRLTLISLATTFGMLLFLIVAMGAVVVLPAVLNFVGLGGTTDLLMRLLRWPLLLLIVIVVLSVLYRYGPSREPARWRWVSMGGAFAAVTWVLVSAGFSWYVQNFGSYNKTYGSLGAVVGFMTWIWISTIVVLIGAELNAEMEHQTATDTTTGRPLPLGARGATKADTVAA